MSATTYISSETEFNELLGSSKTVVVDFYADWCGPCRQIAPHYESLSTKFSKPSEVAFCKVDVDSQRAVAAAQGIRAMPTFIVFQGGAAKFRVMGADPRQLSAAVEWAVDPKAAEAKGLTEPKAGAEPQQAGSGLASWLPMLLGLLVMFLIRSGYLQTFSEYLFPNSVKSE